MPASPANQRSRRCPRPATHARAENLDFGDNPVPIAFVRPRLAVLVWFLAIPLGRLLDRRLPEGAEQYLA